MSLNENSHIILQKSYAQKDEDGNSIETDDQIFWRVANALAVHETSESREKWAQKFHDQMASGENEPNTPTIMNMGTDNPMGSACFVIPVGDSMEEIFAAVYNGANIQRWGGGVGYSFSSLRSTGSRVSTTQGESSGPTSFMNVFDGMCGTIAQGGKRRGAQMGIMRVDHPDILAFIKAKGSDDIDMKKDRKWKNFNVSVAITDDFMAALEEKRTFHQIDPHTKVVTEIDPQIIWEAIIKYATNSADPGLWFIDRANADRPFPAIPLESTNPCGEQALEPYGSCNLSNLNVGMFIKTEKEIDKIVGDHQWDIGKLEPHYTIDWERLGTAVWTIVRLLDDVIESNKTPLQLVVTDDVPVLGDPIGEMSKYSRRIGLGIMGLHDLFMRLHIPYDSTKAVDLSKSLMKFITEEAWRASIQLGDERGPFPGLHDSRVFEYPMVVRIMNNVYGEGEHNWEGKGPRHCNVTTCAPTGTTSRIAGCSSGCEPYFRLVYESHVIGRVLSDACEPFKDYLEEGIAKYYIDEHVEREIIEWAKYFPMIDYLTHRMPSNAYADEKEIAWWNGLAKIFTTTNEIHSMWHIAHQAALQEYTSNSISKTINMPRGTTEAEVEWAYKEAWRSKARGITIYIDGTKGEQPLQAIEGAEKSEFELIRTEYLDMIKDTVDDDISGVTAVMEPKHYVIPMPRPEFVPGGTHKIKVPVNGDIVNAYVTVNILNDDVFEVFVELGDSGSDEYAWAASLGRLISLALRCNIKMDEVIDKLKGIKTDPVAGKEGWILSGPDAIAKLLTRYKNEEITMDEFITTGGISSIEVDLHIIPLGNQAWDGRLCPQCKIGIMIVEGGNCATCNNGACGYSKC